MELVATYTWATIYEGLIKDGVKFPKNFDGIGASYGAYARIIEALETYGNARELEGVEKVKDQYATDIKILKESHEIMLDAISCMTLEAFLIWSEHRKTKVKSELK